MLNTFRLFLTVAFLASSTATHRIEAVSGEEYSIFGPFENASMHHHVPTLIGSPEHFIKDLAMRTSFLAGYLADASLLADPMEYARKVYLKTLIQFLTASVFEELEISVNPRFGTKGQTTYVAAPATAKRAQLRLGGEDWAGLGMTMVGTMRMQSIQTLLADVFRNKIEGAIAETGVWRGGMSIFMRGIMRAYGEDDRLQFVCDSFNGLPPSTYASLEQGHHYDNNPYLEVSDHFVRHNFVSMGLADPNVVFVKGFFSKTMKPLSERYNGKFALLRLDGDMYESTVDVLYHLYDRLAIGGYLVMDDWFGFPSSTACVDFFKAHGATLPKIVPVDKISVYWQKVEEVKIQYWRYEQKKFKP